MENFNEKLKNLRKNTGFSQKEIACKLGITRSAYSNYENGYNEPDFLTLKKICIFFDVTSDYLIGLED